MHENHVNCKNNGQINPNEYTKIDLILSSALLVLIYFINSSCVLLCLFVFVWEGLSLHISGGPKISYVDHAILECEDDSLASVCWVLSTESTGMSHHAKFLNPELRKECVK
jgi:hypothetical protein